MSKSNIHPFLDKALSDASIPELPNHFRGKVRDNYDLLDGRRIIIATDRLSAFDRILTSIPLKGQVLTQTARFWFNLTKDICPNHVIEYADPNVVVAQRLKILPVEIVVRDYLTGGTATSILTMYKEGRREMYGIRLPDGLRENERLPHSIITPTTKASDNEHDEPLTPHDILERGLLTEAQWHTVSSYALDLFARGKRVSKQRGLILVDTKYEFGVTTDGCIVLADEIHTPDSSRYWLLETYDRLFNDSKKPESFDKDFIRNWIVSRCDPYEDSFPDIPQELILKTAQVYINAFETITGEAFAFPSENEFPIERIRRNLASYF